MMKIGHNNQEKSIFITKDSGHFQAILSYWFSRKFFGYLIVGGFNFILTAVVYWILLTVFCINYILSFILSWVIGVVFTYVLNFIYVFKPENKLEFKKRLWRYVIVYAVSLSVNMMLLKIGVDNYDLDPFWYQISLIPVIILINYSGINNWALKKPHNR